MDDASSPAAAQPPSPVSVDTSTRYDSFQGSRSVLWRLYLSHTLSTWNARAFEFGAVIFLATIFPGTLFYASCYALFRSAAAALFSSWLGGLVDRTHRLKFVRHSILWQRLPVATSCVLLLVLLQPGHSRLIVWSCFAASVALACVEKLAFVGNTVSIERDWLIVISDSLEVERQALNSTMRRIDLVCKLLAPLFVSLLDGYSTSVAICVVFGQNAASVVLEYFAIAQVFSAVPELERHKDEVTGEPEVSTRQISSASSRAALSSPLSSRISDTIQPWKGYAQNPAFLASFSLSMLYLTVLSFASQMTTYLLTLGYTSTDIAFMRLVAVVSELSATCAAPALMRRIGAVRSGLWFINEQVLSVALAVGLFVLIDDSSKIAGAALIVGVTFSRVGLWGFDLCVQYLVQEDAPGASRGSFSAIEMSLQNVFELFSFVLTMVFHRPQDFRYPVFISAVAVAVSAACFAGFVRQKRGHLLHTSKCFKREAKARYDMLPNTEEEMEVFGHHS